MNVEHPARTGLCLPSCPAHVLSPTADVCQSVHRYAHGSGPMTVHLHPQRSLSLLHAHTSGYAHRMRNTGIRASLLTFVLLRISENVWKSEEHRDSWLLGISFVPAISSLRMFTSILHPCTLTPKSLCPASLSQLGLSYTTNPLTLFLFGVGS